jgi:hypothetical protein
MRKYAFAAMTASARAPTATTFIRVICHAVKTMTARRGIYRALARSAACATYTRGSVSGKSAAQAMAQLAGRIRSVRMVKLTIFWNLSFS